MKKEQIGQIFTENFKFEVNQELRHRGDSKGYSADMGLLVLNRVIFEATDDDDQKQYERSYICRLVKFSGSGETAQFREKELMTVEEYNEKSMQNEAERDQHRAEVRQIRKEIHAAFGLDENSYVYLKNEKGEVQKDKQYRACGWGMKNGTATLTVREVLIEAGKQIDTDTIEINSPEQFEVVKL